MDLDDEELKATRELNRLKNIEYGINVNTLKKYKLFIKKYNFIKNEYEIIEKIVATSDIYHVIGYIYCNSLEEIKRIDYVELI